MLSARGSLGRWLWRREICVVLCCDVHTAGTTLLPLRVGEFCFVSLSPRSGSLFFKGDGEQARAMNIQTTG